MDSDHGFAFAHTGRFDQGRIAECQGLVRPPGRADSVVGFGLLSHTLLARYESGLPLQNVHRQLGGTANMVHLGRDGAIAIYSGAEGNHMWTFDLDGGRFASTAIHSLDESVFTLCFPGATARTKVAFREELGL